MTIIGAVEQSLTGTPATRKGGQIVGNQKVGVTAVACHQISGLADGCPWQGEIGRC